MTAPPIKGKWRGMTDREYGVIICEVHPWPIVKGTTRIRTVAKGLTKVDALRILDAVGGDWVED